MAALNYFGGVPSVYVTGSREDMESMINDESTQLLADAIKRMDGLIGDYNYMPPNSPEWPSPLLNDPVVTSIIDLCNQLRALMMEWDSKPEDKRIEDQHPRDYVPMEVKRFVVSWLTKQDIDISQSSDQLRKDKAELLKQVVLTQKQLEASEKERERLKTKVFDYEKKLIDKEQQIRSLSEDLRATRVTLQSKEVEVRHLKDQIQAGHRNISPLHTERGKSVRVVLPDKALSRMAINRKSSFKKTFVKRFTKKKDSRSLSSPEAANDDDEAGKALNPREEAFNSMDGKQLTEWFQTIGLDMYSDIVEQKLPWGEKLNYIMKDHSISELLTIGIVSTLHCKKLRLAVEDATSETPSRVGALDHHWVAEWLEKIGLPQYQRTFLDARIDGRMLDNISMEDLNLLDVNVPFHLISFKRAIQALRMCGYSKNFLAQGSSEKVIGSQKLLHWTAKDVANWIRTIDLDEYIGGLENAGIHGAVMLLDVQFTSESLARALKISNTKTLIRTHLSRKFMELIGPIAAQKKVDAMQVKGFQPHDPTEPPKRPYRTRSRSVGTRRGKSLPSQEELLCSFDEFPAPAVSLQHSQLTATASCTPDLLSSRGSSSARTVTTPPLRGVSPIFDRPATP